MTAIFVPGRVCLLGEHSDWAGMREGTHPGHCIVYGTDCGIHATVTVTSSATIVVVNDGSKSVFEGPLDVSWLLEVARRGTFYSYICGTAAVMLQHYPPSRDNKGLHVHITRADLPVQKGLSSSAAVCVLIVKAFCLVYGVHVTDAEMIHLAFEGEVQTPSKCGKMDQCVVFGKRCTVMDFDGPTSLQFHDVPIPTGFSFHFVVADLGSHKDTALILSELQHAFDSPCGDEVGDAVKCFLGPVSARMVRRMEDAVKAGDPELVGTLMCEYQGAFSAALVPACPTQLTAPRLNKILLDPRVRELSLGGKGVGSQGDGSVQFVCRNSKQQLALCTVLEELGCIPMAFRL